MNKKKVLKIIGKSALCLLLLVVVAVCGYATYFVSAFNRIDDNLALSPTSAEGKNISTTKKYTLLSWNVGFAAYSDDYSFFMDGGKYSRAFSKEAVEENLQGFATAVKKISDENTTSGLDFICYQEIDYDSTRSYFVDQRKFFVDQHPSYSSVFAQNYDSPYILYPFNSPHGANKAGLMTFSKYQIKSAIRKQLPIESGFTKFFDLDRCYSKSRIEVSNGKDLVIVNLHLSAYTSDGTIAIEQLKLLLQDCKEEYEKGNYVVCAGDFNKDLIDAADGGSSALFKQDADPDGWAKNIDPAIFDGTNMTKVAPLKDKNNPVPTCRNADKPYSEGNRIYIIDGFLVSSNVEVSGAIAIDEQFKHSDHNPVLLTFKLK